MADYASLIPINVITGFLGSGKTTVLQRLLRSPALRDTAVLVNEFGEVGLDHHLIEHAAESTVLLENGCLCCAVRGDLKGSLRDLLSRRDRGEIALARVVIETSGLADPVPIAYTVLAEPVIQHHFRLGNVVTAVDAVNGAGQLARFPESVKQVAVADRLVLTKTDICPAERAAALRAELARVNPSAPVLESAGALDPERLLTDDAHGPGGRRDEAERWRQAAGGEGQAHDHGVTSFCLFFDSPLDWTAFGIWMTMLLHRHGENVLRVKGMLDVAGVAEPVLINGVQHIVHPPAHLDGWPNTDRRSRLVFITRDIPRARIEASLAAFNALANPSDGAAPGTAAGAVAGSAGVAVRRF
jgi:G3E family GTPase